MTQAIIFDDGRGQLAPLTDLRPACAVRTGALTGLERLQLALGLKVLCIMVGEDAKAVASESVSVPVSAGPYGEGDVLLINSRCPLGYEVISALGPGECVTEAGTGDVVAARGPASAADALSAGETTGWRRAAELPAPALLSRPWHVRTFRDRCLAADLALLQRGQRAAEALPGVTVITGPAGGGSPVRAAGATTGFTLTIDPTAKIYPTATFDIEHGSIVIAEGAVVRPGAFIAGPAYIGAHSTVLDKALIKGNTAIGPQCKVAGEIGGTIFQGYANKAHDGHLGDSWIGQWVNLGAGTTNSNLLNTYGEVIAKGSPGGSNERTGEQFLGCIIGDHVKAAICTRIMTGAVVHTGTMWAASAPIAGCVAGFSWVTDAGAKAFRFDKFLEVARAAMARRKMVPSAAYVQQLQELSRAAESRR